MRRKLLIVIAVIGLVTLVGCSGVSVGEQPSLDDLFSDTPLEGVTDVGDGSPGEYAEVRDDGHKAYEAVFGDQITDRTIDETLYSTVEYEWHDRNYSGHEDRWTKLEDRTSSRRDRFVRRYMDHFGDDKGEIGYAEAYTTQRTNPEEGYSEYKVRKFAVISPGQGIYVAERMPPSRAAGDVGWVAQEFSQADLQPDLTTHLRVTEYGTNDSRAFYSTDMHHTRTTYMASSVTIVKHKTMHKDDDTGYDDKSVVPTILNDSSLKYQGMVTLEGHDEPVAYYKIDGIHKWEQNPTREERSPITQYHTQTYDDMDGALFVDQNYRPVLLKYTIDKHEKIGGYIEYQYPDDGPTVSNGELIGGGWESFNPGWEDHSIKTPWWVETNFRTAGIPSRMLGAVEHHDGYASVKIDRLDHPVDGGYLQTGLNMEDRYYKNPKVGVFNTPNEHQMGSYRGAHFDFTIEEGDTIYISAQKQNGGYVPVVSQEPPENPPSSYDYFQGVTIKTDDGVVALRG